MTADELVEVPGSHIRWAIKLDLPMASNQSGVLPNHAACGCLVMPAWCDIIIQKTRLSRVSETTIERALLHCLRLRSARDAVMAAWHARGCDGVTDLVCKFGGCDVPWLWFED